MSLVLIVGSSTRAAVATDAPLGDKNFYPSPDRPVGFRGDGNGYFPGATPVGHWREGTVVKDEETNEFIATDHNSLNIVWKTEMPSWANTQPVVVGERVFTTAEPNLLVCVDANTGKIRWTVAANPWELRGAESGKAERLQAMYDVWREGIPRFENMCHETTICRVVPSKEFLPVANLFVERVLPRLVKQLRELDPEGTYDRPAAETIAALNKYSLALAGWEKEGAGRSGPVEKHDPIKEQMCSLANYLARRIDVAGGISGAGTNRVRAVPLDVQWDHITGFCASAPVSDGEFVYASFGQGQTICCDLDGKRIWGTQFATDLGKENLTSLHSPLLSGNVLIDMHGGTNVLRGLDKLTGKLVWEQPSLAPGVRSAGGYDVGSHKLLRLKRADKLEDVLVTTQCNIIRSRDGRSLGTLPFEYPVFGGPSIAASGDVVVKGACGDNYRAPIVAYRLQFTGDDRVEAKEIWRTRHRSTPGYQSIVMTPTAIFMDSFEHTALSTLSGDILLHDPATPMGGFSNLVAGNLFIWADDGSKHWATRGKEVFGNFGMVDVGDPAKPRPRSDNNVLGGVDTPRVPAMEKYAPELYAMDVYRGKTYGRPSHFMHADTTMFPSGNRLFIRSVSHLYCIGDPTAPYDWNPASMNAGK